MAWFSEATHCLPPSSVTILSKFLSQDASWGSVLVAQCIMMNSELTHLMDLLGFVISMPSSRHSTPLIVTLLAFFKLVLGAGIKLLVEPFWKNLPYAHIYQSITPDILHQLNQGVIKHLIGRITKACGADEINIRCRQMPPNHNV